MAEGEERSHGRRREGGREGEAEGEERSHGQRRVLFDAHPRSKGVGYEGRNYNLRLAMKADRGSNSQEGKEKKGGSTV